MCAVLVTCPWYEMTQRERGEQARHNTVYVVYLADDQTSMAPVNQHVIDEAFVSDMVRYDCLRLVLFQKKYVGGLDSIFYSTVKVQ